MMGKVISKKNANDGSVQSDEWFVGAESWTWLHSNKSYVSDLGSEVASEFHQARTDAPTTVSSLTGLAFWRRRQR